MIRDGLSTLVLESVHEKEEDNIHTNRSPELH